MNNRLKKTIGLLMAVALMAALPVATAEDDGTARLTVIGSASILLSPDYATLSLGVSTQAQTLTEAQANNATVMNAVLAALQEAGVAPADMQTSHFMISPVYGSDSGLFSSGDGGFRVENSLNVTIRDLLNISIILDAAVQGGANQSYGLTFESTKRSEAYERALQDAVQDAQHKAGLLAQAAGKNLGNIISVTEQSPGYYVGYGKAVMMDANAATPILSGTLSVDATVEMTYAMP